MGPASPTISCVPDTETFLASEAIRSHYAGTAVFLKVEVLHTYFALICGNTKERSRGTNVLRKMGREHMSLWKARIFQNVWCTKKGVSKAESGLPPWPLWVFEQVTPGLEYVVV